MVIEVYSLLESTVVSKKSKSISDWVYELRDVMQKLGGLPKTNANKWFNLQKSNALKKRNSLLNDLHSAAKAKLLYANPSVPTTILRSKRKKTSDEFYLFGMFRLTPDNLVSVRSRSAGLSDPIKYLTNSESLLTLAKIGDSSPRNGAFEYDDGSVELYAGGAYRTALATAGTPVRVMVTRQEIVPSQRDPIFCRIKNRSFFAFKNQDPLLPASIRGFDKQQIGGINVFNAVAREYVDRERVATSGTALGMVAEAGNGVIETYPIDISVSSRVDAMPQAPAVTPTLGFGNALANQFGSMITNSEIAGAGAAWRFALAHHPQTIELLRAVKAGLDRLYKRETQSDSRAATGSMTVPFDFKPDYYPLEPWVDMDSLPEDELEFKPDQAYALQNWELLYHTPMAVAEQLIRVGRFDDARKWIARVFNPRDTEVQSGEPEYYWVFKPFYDFVAGDGVGDFKNLNPDGSGDPYLRNVFRALIKQWRANPYNPHAVAVFRPQAYQLASIFLYIENLIAWGDFLFAAPSAELVEEAARRYEEAEHIIGRPQVSTGAIRDDSTAFTVGDLEQSQALGSADLENALSVGNGASPHVEDAFLPDLAIGYFCLPPNPKIKELRDKIQDRLFKAHHCLDLLGNPRKLPLYDPPIDPGLLADAAMAGLNVSQTVMDAYTPRPHYRFRTLLTLAKGLVQQVSSLGNGLLSAMEKRDAESLNLLKATHESQLLKRASEIRKLQVEDAEASINTLEATLNSVEFRHEFYSSREFMNAEEVAQILLSLASTYIKMIGQTLNIASSGAGVVPDMTVGGAGWAGSPVALTTTGGGNFSPVPAGLGQAMGMYGDLLSTVSSITGSMGSYRRRQEDWDYQAENAQLEAKQINAQIIGAKIRQTTAERELTNHETQIEKSREELDFVRTKQTSVSLYEWLVADIGASYYRAFQLAHSMALQAQRALQDEFGSNQRYIGYSHWDGSHNGLQAGERLMQELSEMESQYHGQNARPVVKTMNVSLAQVDPIALAELKVNGTCTFDLPEEFWDQYAPGLYFRRFASVAVSVPAVVGPFSGLHGRLSIESAEYRRDPTLPEADSGEEADSYILQGDDDARFIRQFRRPGDYIVLSTGTQDTGLGGDEAREDRYRPFENLGVASTWRLDISQRDNAFDLSTISDVILHVEYTARDGGETLQDAARSALKKRSTSEGFLVSLRHQYAGEWQDFKIGEEVEIDFEPQLSWRDTNRDGRKLAGLNVAVLLSAKEQPNDNVTCSATLTPPAAISDELEVESSNVFDVSFDSPINGGVRLGLAFQQWELTDGNASDELLFELLRNSSWKIQRTTDSGIELEDAVVAVTWKLDGVPLDV
ncbi:MAG: hypothetical protein DIZ77_03495 [endosymbiont of Seepiophila jonesi]|nr:MAG: hypothetical protein DIZ77_03495 [endosymbiont of Seepiophila jonesi]